MSSKTEICNLAVSWLGGNRITSVEHDDTLEARLCRANYEMSRTSVLEEREWTFAAKRIELTPMADEPSFGFRNKFMLPSHLLRVIGVYNINDKNVQQPETITYLVEGNTILCNEEVIHVKYISDEINTALFSSLFNQALAAHIASNICTALTENVTLQSNMYMLYEDKLYRASSSDALQGSRELFKKSQLEKSRRMYVREK